MDIDLELAPADQPGVVRRPDLVVVGYKAIDRVDSDGRLLRASDVLVVVEIVSPGSRRLDHVVKRHDYANAGVGHYWIVDLDEPVTLLDCHLADPLGYANGGSITGTFTTTAPCPIRLELDRLLALRNPRVSGALSAPSSTGELCGSGRTALLSNSATVESITDHEIYGTRLAGGLSGFCHRANTRIITLTVPHPAASELRTGHCRR